VLQVALQSLMQRSAQQQSVWNQWSQGSLSARHCAAQHSTTQHSSAQHCTAHHSLVFHSKQKHAQSRGLCMQHCAPHHGDSYGQAGSPPSSSSWAATHLCHCRPLQCCPMKPSWQPSAAMPYSCLLTLHTAA